MNTSPEPRISIAEFERLTDAKLPLVGQYGIRVETIEAGRVVMRMPAQIDTVLR